MNLKNTFNEDSFEYTTMNDIIAEGMKQPKREPLYKNLWYEKEHLCNADSQTCSSETTDSIF